MILKFCSAKLTSPEANTEQECEDGVTAGSSHLNLDAVKRFSWADSFGELGCEGREKEETEEMPCLNTQAQFRSRCKLLTSIPVPTTHASQYCCED